MLSNSHYLLPWILPPGLNILLMFSGWLLSFRLPILGKLLIATGFISLWLLSTPYVAYQFVDSLQNQYAMLPPNLNNQTQAQDAIVVLGGGDAVELEYSNKRTVSDQTVHRLQYAAHLYQQTHLPVIVSGGKPIGAIESEADLMATMLHDNYQMTDIIKEDKSQSTADESQLLQSILQQHHFKNVYLVTNAWHMPRSVFLFQRAGITVTPAPMGYYVYNTGYALISFLPNIEALSASAIALHEYLGIAWYRVS